MIQLHVGHISLDRAIPSLSGGEIQRIRISNQLNCSLKGLIYILDEPCRGLHLRDIDGIIKATHDLVDNDNTVIAIEHNKKYVASADNIINMGPEGGNKGGYIISLNRDIKDTQYNLVFKRPRTSKKYVSLEGVSYRNIINQDITFPVGLTTCVTGVSGSGKSTFFEVLSESYGHTATKICHKINGLNDYKKLIKVNQKPIGKTPRSTVISYLDIYDDIRNLLANTDTAKNLGLTASDFSMNVKGGRCEECQGTGMKRIELTYLPDTYIVCPKCEGRRFSSEVLNVRYNGLSINDILDTPISQLIDKFNNVSSIYEKLVCMDEIGLGYIKLGQMSMNLSGGEAQRIKLAKCLSSKSPDKTLYLLDEPTSGLSDVDIDRLGNIIDKLSGNGATMLIIEHNLEFAAKYADYVIDFGNYAGDDGGVVTSVGSPECVYHDKNSSWYGVV